MKLPKRLRSWAQSREDIALLTQYYSRPLRCNGTFLEIGALDGIIYSDTLMFEKYLGWNGILIEAQRDNIVSLRKNRPKAKVYGVAVCEEGVGSVQFAGRGAIGGVLKEMTKKHFDSWILSNMSVPVPCKPLSWILRDANVHQIDFFILDVEGAEYNVLRTMNWSVPVGVFVVEVHPGDPEAKDDHVHQLLTDHGYRKADWDIASYCPQGGPCTSNDVYENTALVFENHR